MATPSRERQLVGNVWQYRTVEESGGGGGLPSGGSTGQVLTKESNADGDVGWEAGGGSQAGVEQVVLPIAFDTPGLVIPATGPAGIKVCDLAIGDMIVGFGSDAMSGEPNYADVSEAWDGTTPNLLLVSTPDRGTLPGSPPLPSAAAALGVASYGWDSGGTLFYKVNSALFTTPIVCRVATALWAYVDDGANGDPESTQGAGNVRLLIARAPA